jgi:hypothetical protein
MHRPANGFFARSLMLLVFTLAVSAMPSLARAQQGACNVGKAKFDDAQACALSSRLLHGEQVPFRPMAVMGLINDICEALEGRMDERLKNDRRKTLFRTVDGFDCYQKGEPIRLPPMRAANFIRQPLILVQSSGRRR